MGGRGGGEAQDGIAGVERKLRMRAFSALNSVLKSTNVEKYVEYSKLKDDVDRRQWLAAFLVDPASGGSIARNTVEREITTAESGKHAWMTIEEFGGPKGINSLGRARRRCAGGEFPFRAHESSVLA